MQIPDFRHYAQSSVYETGHQRAVLWVPRRDGADASSFSRYAAKLISGTDRKNMPEKDSDFSDLWK
jgi:hypothetical protein